MDVDAVLGEQDVADPLGLDRIADHHRHDVRLARHHRQAGVRQHRLQPRRRRLLPLAEKYDQKLGYEIQGITSLGKRLIEDQEY